RLAARGDEPLLVQILREPLDRLRLRPGEGIEGRSDRLSLLLDLLAVLRVPERSPAGQDRHTLGPSALVRSDGPLGLALSLEPGGSSPWCGAAAGLRRPRRRG